MILVIMVNPDLGIVLCHLLGAEPCELQIYLLWLNDAVRRLWSLSSLFGIGIDLFSLECQDINN